jgi:hypothetical protein
MSEPPVLSSEPMQKDPSGRSPFAGPDGLHLLYNKTHYLSHGTCDTSSTKRSDEIARMALEVWQSTCIRHCDGNPADIVDGQNGSLNHFDQGYTYVRGFIVCKTNNAYAFGCDW